MALHFTKTLQEALEEIEFKENHQFVIHDKEEERIDHDNVISVYGEAKWKIVDLLNQQYSTILKDKFDLYNWLNKNKDDEVSYFLNEVGSNSLAHSQFKAPYKFHLWLGAKGFIIGIEQKGEGFNAELVNINRIKENEGAAFEFFRSSKSEIFFDDIENAKMVYLQSFMAL